PLQRRAWAACNAQGQVPPVVARVFRDRCSEAPTVARGVGGVACNGASPFLWTPPPAQAGTPALPPGSPPRVLPQVIPQRRPLALAQPDGDVELLQVLLQRLAPQRHLPL